MTSVERLKFLADKGDECWLGLSNVEAIKDVLKQLEDLTQTSIRLSKECVELEEENKRLIKDVKGLETMLYLRDDEDSIPISVIQNKINTYKEMIEERPYDKAIIEIHISELQELLEEVNK